jgi:hypothetical protein
LVASGLGLGISAESIAGKVEGGLELEGDVTGRGSRFTWRF